MRGARVLALGLRLALGVTGGAALWAMARDAGRTDTAPELLVSGALVLCMIGLTQEACRKLIDDAIVGYRVASVGLALLVIAGLQAVAGLLADRPWLAASVVSWALALAFLAASGRLIDPEYRRVLRALQAIRDAQSARAAIERAARESGQPQEPQQPRESGRVS